jgi:hypothetical protein
MAKPYPRLFEIVDLWAKKSQLVEPWLGQNLTYWPWDVSAATPVSDVHPVDEVVDDLALGDVHISSPVTDIKSCHMVISRHNRIVDMDPTVHPLNLMEPQKMVKKLWPSFLIDPITQIPLPEFWSTMVSVTLRS